VTTKAVERPTKAMRNNAIMENILPSDRVAIKKRRGNHSLITKIQGGFPQR
jgi:hypothetical protein